MWKSSCGTRTNVFFFKCKRKDKEMSGKIEGEGGRGGGGGGGGEVKGWGIPRPENGLV